MLHSNICLLVLGITIFAFPSFAASQQMAPSRPKVDIKGKLVVANLDRFPVTFRIGKIRKQVQPRKATVLSPKRFPFSLELWNGSKQQPAWERKSVTEAGIYVFRFQNGRWSLTKHQSRTTANSPTKPNTPKSTVNRYPTVRSNQTFRRMTGTPNRIYRRSPTRFGVNYGPRFPLLRRVAFDVFWLWNAIDNEDLRQALWEGIVRDEIDREILDEIAKVPVNLPAEDRAQFDRIWNDLQGLTDQDIRDLEGASDAEWDQVRDDLGDQVTDNAWREFESGLESADIDAIDGADTLDLDQAGIDSLESDLELDALDTGQDMDFGEFVSTMDNLDFGDLGGADAFDFGNQFGPVDGMIQPDMGGYGGDLGGYGGDFGGYGGYGGDYGGYGGDFGGDFGGGDYDVGGFDDFGGGFDMGGGFDDFGGGFDDFGGGFDDF